MAIDKLTNDLLKSIQKILIGNLRDTICNAVSVSNINLTYNNGIFETTANSIDGVDFAFDGKRYLLANQNEAKYNGIYAVVGLNPTLLTRVSDCTTYEQINNTRVQITEGTLEGTFYLITTMQPFALNITDINVLQVEESLQNLQNIVANVKSDLDNYINDGTIDCGNF